MKTIKNIQSQQGWTIWSMLFVMSVVFVLAYIGMQLVPIYTANDSIKKAMIQSVEGKNLRQVTRRQIIGAMNNQLYIDGNHEILDYKNDFVVKRTGKNLTMQANYDREVPLVYNLVMVARFETKVECELTGRCE